MATKIPITTYTTVPFTFEEAVEEFNRTSILKEQVHFGEEFLRDIKKLVGDNVHEMHTKLLDKPKDRFYCGNEKTIKTEPLSSESILLNYVLFYDSYTKKLSFRMGGVTEQDLQQYLSLKKTKKSKATIEFVTGTKHLQLCDRDIILFSGVLIKEKKEPGFSITLNPMSGTWFTVMKYLLNPSVQSKNRLPPEIGKEPAALNCLNLLMARYMLNKIAREMGVDITFHDECLLDYYTNYISTDRMMDTVRPVCKSEIPTLLSIPGNRYGDFIEKAEERLKDMQLFDRKITDIITAKSLLNEIPVYHKGLTFGELVRAIDGIKSLEILLKDFDFTRIPVSTRPSSSSTEGGSRKDQKYITYKNRKYRVHEGPRQGNFILVGKEKKKVYLH